jgi:WD40 repeat protein
VTAGDDGTARIWDAKSGKELETLGRRHGAYGLNTVNSAAFSPDGERVVTANADGAAQIWECGVAFAPLPKLLKLAPRLAGTLSAAERARYLAE